MKDGKLSSRGENRKVSSDTGHKTVNAFLKACKEKYGDGFADGIAARHLKYYNDTGAPLRACVVKQVIEKGKEYLLESIDQELKNIPSIKKHIGNAEFKNAYEKFLNCITKDINKSPGKTIEEIKVTLKRNKFYIAASKNFDDQSLSSEKAINRFKLLQCLYDDTKNGGRFPLCYDIHYQALKSIASDKTLTAYFMGSDKKGREMLLKDQLREAGKQVVPEHFKELFNTLSEKISLSLGPEIMNDGAFQKEINNLQACILDEIIEKNDDPTQKQRVSNSTLYEIVKNALGNETLTAQDATDRVKVITSIYRAGKRVMKTPLESKHKYLRNLTLQSIWENKEEKNSFMSLSDSECLKKYQEKYKEMKNKLVGYLSESFSHGYGESEKKFPKIKAIMSDLIDNNFDLQSVLFLSSSTFNFRPTENALKALVFMSLLELKKGEMGFEDILSKVKDRMGEEVTNMDAVVRHYADAVRSLKETDVITPKEQFKDPLLTIGVRVVQDNNKQTTSDQKNKEHLFSDFVRGYESSKISENSTKQDYKMYSTNMTIRRKSGSIDLLPMWDKKQKDFKKDTYLNTIVDALEELCGKENQNQKAVVLTVMGQAGGRFQNMMTDATEDGEQNGLPYHIEVFQNNEGNIQVMRKIDDKASFSFSYGYEIDKDGNCRELPIVSGIKLSESPEA